MIRFSFLMKKITDMIYVPYFLCNQIIDKSIGNGFSYQDVIEVLSFKNNSIYKRSNKVPILEYYNLIHRAEKLGFNILKVYNKKEDILFNYSRVYPQFGIVCLNSKNLLSAIYSYLLISGGEEYNSSKVIQVSHDVIKIKFNPPCDKLKNSIYLPLGNMIVLMGLAKYYLYKFNDYKISMDFISGSQPVFESEIIKDLECNVNLNRLNNSMLIKTSHLKTKFDNYNESLSYIKDMGKFKSFLFKDDNVYENIELINEISTIISGFYSHSTDGKCSIEYVSSKLNIPIWTLQRRLSKVDKTYSEILNKVLIDLATDYLKDQVYSIGSISEMLGFSSQASFTRFFKSSMGMTPLSYRHEFNHAIFMNVDNV